LGPALFVSQSEKSILIDMEPAPTPIPQKAPGAYGSLFSIIMIVVILVVGAFYVWNKRVAQNYQYATDETETLQVEVAVPAE
jgi:hypothetical protein